MSELAMVAREFRHGRPIPRIKYTEAEVATWGAVSARGKRVLVSIHTHTPFLKLDSVMM
jgi:hypothetical protein